MAQKDLNEKLLEEYNDVFADIFNTLLFKNLVLKEEHLERGPTESVYKAEQGHAAGQLRDINKKYNDNRLCILSLGIENQSIPDNSMPIRVMGYDYGSYKNMLEDTSIPYPVTTIVLNFGSRKWNAAKSIHEFLHLSDELKPYVEDYKIRVYDIAFLSDNVINKFKSDFKVIARFFKEKRLGKQTLFEDDSIKLKHIGAILDFLSVFTNDNRYREAYTKNIQNLEAKGETIHMCQIAQGLIDRGMSQGLSQGLSACVSALKIAGMSFEKTCEIITATEVYTDVTKEQIMNYYDN